MTSEIADKAFSKFSQEEADDVIAKYQKTEFVHLHNHSQFSFLDGVASVSQYVSNCHKRGYPAHALTEHGHMASVPDLYFECQKYGIKPIFGCEIYLNNYEPWRQGIQNLIANETDKEFVFQPDKYREILCEYNQITGAATTTREITSTNRIETIDYQKYLDNFDVGNSKSFPTYRQIKHIAPLLSERLTRNRHLTVLVKNEIGYHNLLKLTSEAFEFGYYYKPRIWFKKLCEYKEGLIVLSGCMNGPIAHEIRLDARAAADSSYKFKRTKYDKTATQHIKEYKAIFGEDYYMEVQMPCLHDIYDHIAFEKLIEYADSFKIKPVLTNDVHYFDRKAFRFQKAMMAIDQDTNIYDENLFHVNSDEQYFKTRGELYSTFKRYKYSDNIADEAFERACDTTLEIAEKCYQPKFDTTPKIPDWKVVEGKDADTELLNKVEQALREKGWYDDQTIFSMDGRKVTYRQQAELECNRFIEKGFASYFLITADLIAYGKSRGYPFGPRGSAGGSLVIHLLGISNMNPMVWRGLTSFDRFLSSSRGGYLLKVKME